MKGKEALIYFLLLNPKELNLWASLEEGSIGFYSTHLVRNKIKIGNLFFKSDIIPSILFEASLDIEKMMADCFVCF